MQDKYSSFFPLDNSLGFIVYRTSLEIKACLQRRFRDKGYDITPEQWSILARLWEEEGLTQKQIADRTYKDKANITRLVDVLEKRGLLERRADPADRRRYYIHLTESGRGLKEKLLAVAYEIVQVATRDVNREDIEAAKKTLNTVYNNLS